MVIEDVMAIALSSADDSKLKPYHNVHKELEQIDHIACHTLHDCMQKVFEDGPNVIGDFGWEIFDYRHWQTMRHIR